MVSLSLKNRSSSRSGGFSLVEIMIALLIGMISMVVVLQVYSISEASRRTTSGSDDAQASGALGLFLIEQDLSQAGYGLTAQSILGCNVTLPSGVVLNNIAPVTINHASIPAGDLKTDTLLIVYGNTNNGAPEGDKLLATPTTMNIYSMTTPTSYLLNDRVIATLATRPTPCTLILDKVTGLPTISTPSNITVGTGMAGLTGGLTGGTVFNLGQSPVIKAYAVRNGMLTLCDFFVNDCSNAAQKNNTDIWAPVAGNIASLRAEYGRDTAVTMDGVVDYYDQTGGTKCDWLRRAAVRFAVVARNGQYDKTAPTSTALTWEGTAASSTNTATPIDLSDNVSLPAGATWKNFRYRVYQTVVPLRNVTWLGAQSGC